ncbi:12107_t:CDS:1, partial [Gigaspora margarita]
EINHLACIKGVEMGVNSLLWSIMALANRSQQGYIRYESDG